MKSWDMVNVRKLHELAPKSNVRGHVRNKDRYNMMRLSGDFSNDTMNIGTDTHKDTSVQTQWLMGN